MDLLYLCTLYPPAIGGAEIHLHCLAKQMQALGHGVKVITCGSRNRTDWLRLATVLPEPRRDYVWEGVPVAQLGYSVASRLRMAPWAMSYYATIGPPARRLGEIVYDEVPWPRQTPAVVHVSRIGREFLALAALKYARRHGVPFVLTPNHHPRWRGYNYREYDRLYREADALIALTTAEKQLLVREKHVREDRVHVTGIGPVLSDRYSIEEFRARSGVSGPFVLFLGQQFRYKGVGALIDAAPLVWQKHPDVRFVFIGPPTEYSRVLFTAVKDPRLINLGSVDLETKTAALAACELLCLPSDQESFGGVFVEAWSLRKAVIGGRIPAIAKVIDHGKDGLLSSQSPGELASTINQLLDDPGHCQAMGAAGWAKVQARFSWERLAEKTLAVYRTLGHQPAEKPPAAIVKRPLKVLMCHNYYQQRGGEDQSFADEVRLLESNGHDVLQFTCHNNVIDAMGPVQKVRSTLWNRQVQDELRALIRRQRPDVVHFNNTFPLISPAAYFAARREGVPVVQALRNYRTLCLNAMMLRDGKVCEDCLGRTTPWPGVLHACYRQSRPATAVVGAMLMLHRAMKTWQRAVTLYYTPSEFSRQKFIEGGLSGERILVKPNAVVPDPGVGPGDGGYAVFVGRLSPEKGVGTLLRAWRDFKLPLPLKIIGDGPMGEQVRGAAAADERIEWLGYRPLSDVLAIVGRATFLVMPSIWYETFGRSIMEAFAKGTPAIVSRLGAMAQLVDDGRTGLYVEPGDPVDLAAKVRQILSDPASLARMRRAARREYELKYTAARNYRRLLEIYQTAIALNGGQADAIEPPESDDDGNGELLGTSAPKRSVRLPQLVAVD